MGTVPAQQLDRLSLSCSACRRGLCAQCEVGLEVELVARGVLPPPARGSCSCSCVVEEDRARADSLLA